MYEMFANLVVLEAPCTVQIDNIHVCAYVCAYVCMYVFTNACMCAHAEVN
jgi:hypothetical protein